MNAVTSVFNQYINYNTPTKIIFSVVVFLLFVLLRKIFTKWILKILFKITSKTSAEIDDRLITSFESPFKIMFTVLGVFIAIYILPLDLGIKTTVLNIIRMIFIILIAWGFYNFLDCTGLLFKNFEKKAGRELNNTIVPFVTKILKAILVALTIVILISELGYDISGFIAGIGLAGLAFALAAQETIANIFGGIVIILDKPFAIGDWIKTPSIEGIVEDINLRSTRIRTFEQAIVVMPNSKLMSEPITNWTRMGKRRARFHIRVTYSTSKDKLEKCINEIKSILCNHPEVNQEMHLVRFEYFNNSSFDILVQYFTNTIDYVEFMRIREDINYKIMEILEKEGVSFAFPSTSVYIEEMPKATEN